MKGIIHSMKKLIKEYLVILLGVLLFTFYVTAILVPSKVGTGGITGVALCFHKLFNTPIGIFTIGANIPLFILAYKITGRKFCVRSMLVIVLSSVAIDYVNTNIKIPTLNDRLLAAIFAGVVSGVSMSLLFMDDASTGGFDILAKILTQKTRIKNISKVMFVQDVMVYAFIGVILGPTAVMYAVIMSFVRSKTIDAMREGISSSRQCIIVCENAEAIVDSISKNLVRSATILEAKGGYTHFDKKVLYCVIQKYQLSLLKNIINEIEPTAFVTVSPVNEILGNYKQLFKI